ncbi:MAG: hypothetical protein KF865_15115 [Bdellovibrionaceae bacterium]|nr:hypothetical protein [Pseudobdellovibrionaceae bacterium]
MPELAEVETVRRHLHQLLKGQTIREVTVDHEDRHFYQFTKSRDVVRALKGARVTGSGRRGKYFWLELDRKPWPIFHLGMTGNVSVVDPGRKSPPRHLWGGLKLQAKPDPKELKRFWFARIILETKKGVQVALIDPRRFGRMWLDEDPPRHPRIARLGDDPLVDFPSAKALHEKLRRRRRAIKAVLLDQTLFAGIGNWLADEILFQAKLSPHRLASQLSAVEVARLRKKIVEVCRAAVAFNADYELFPESWLFHHRWGKSKTARTSRGHPIIHEEIGGRTTAWVPRVQK